MNSDLKFSNKQMISMKIKITLNKLLSNVFKIYWNNFCDSIFPIPL